jgi:hypothetical protein
LSVDKGYEEPSSPDYHHTVWIETNPPGAEVTCYLLDFHTGRPDIDKPIRVKDPTPTTVEVNNGMYLVVARSRDGWHEVFRSVPKRANESIDIFACYRWEYDRENKWGKWPPIRLFKDQLSAEELIAVPGADSFAVDMTHAGGPIETWKVPPFLVEATEVSVANYQRHDDRQLIHGKRPPNLPAGNLSWMMAAEYAESRGLRLLDLVEAELLATNGGTTEYPWGKASPPAGLWDFDQPVGAATIDQMRTNPRIRGLYSGLLEWTSTRSNRGINSDGSIGTRFIVRGGPLAAINERELLHAKGHWGSVSQQRFHPGLGVRCARSIGPHWNPEDFLRLAP